MSSKRTLRIALVLGVVGLLAIAWRLGIFEQFADPARVRRTLLDLGSWGYLAFIGAYTALQPFGVPGTVFILAAPLIWTWPVAFCLSMVGSMAASVVGFAFARVVARDWIAEKVPAKFRRYEGVLERRGLLTVFVLRVVFWMPPLLHAFFGVSKVPFWTHFWGSFVGYVPPLLLVSYFGQQLFDAITSAPTGVWIGAGVGLALVAMGAWVLRRRRCPSERKS